jgi:hypothetical protein
MSDRIENAYIEGYITILTEPHRPPSRGGNTNGLSLVAVANLAVASAIGSRAAPKAPAA